MIGFYTYFKNKSNRDRELRGIPFQLGCRGAGKGKRSTCPRYARDNLGMAPPELRPVASPELSPELSKP
jgi:hypothetical protein